MSVRLILITATSAALLAGGCASMKAASTPPSTPKASAAAGAPAAAMKAVTIGKHGADTILTSNGFALYYFDPDTPTTSACTGACAQTWPPAAGPVTPGPGLPVAQFATIARPDGSTQATFGGHPLYRYSGDSAPGQVNGDGIAGTWHLIGLDDAGSAGGISSPSAADSSAAATASMSSAGGRYGY